jgi:hypothetical protein
MTKAQILQKLLLLKAYNPQSCSRAIERKKVQKAFLSCFVSVHLFYEKNCLFSFFVTKSQLRSFGKTVLESYYSCCYDYKVYLGFVSVTTTTTTTTASTTETTTTRVEAKKLTITRLNKYDGEAKIILPQLQVKN